MLGINCLLKNTVAVQHIKDAIEMVVGERIEAGSTATFPEVYNDLRKAGLEVDAESAGAIYDAFYGAIDDAALSTAEEVEEFAGKDFKKQLDAIVDEINEETTEPGTQQIGRMSPEKHAVTSIAKMFQTANFPHKPRLVSAMRQMQDLVTKAAKSTLPKDENKKQPASLGEALEAFFNTDDTQFQTVDGQVNTMETLHKAVKKEVQNYVDQAADKLSDEDAETFRNQWDEYTKAFIESSYDIILGKGNQNSLVNEALKKVELDGVSIIDFNGNPKWSALIEHGDPATINKKVTELFQKGFEDSKGVQIKLSEAKAQRVGDYFQRLYEKRLEDAKVQAAKQSRAKNLSAKNIVSDFVKDQGFFNLVKNKDGKLLLEQADWDNIIKQVKRDIDKRELGKDAAQNQIRGLDLVQNSLHAFLNQKDADGNPKYKLTPDQIRKVENAFVEAVYAKMQPATGEASDIDRIIALDKLNESKAFNEETQQAVNKLVGVSGLNQKVLKQLQDLTKLAQAITEGGIVTGSTSADPATNRGAYAFTAMVEIDRKIKEIIRQFKIDNSDKQRAVKYISDMLGSGTVSLLLNPNNILENVNTQIGTNVAETFNLMFTNPKLFWKTFGKLQTDFWTQFLNYAQGGASNDIANETDLNTDLQSSERLRFRGIMNEFKGKSGMGTAKALGSVVAKSVPYAVSIFSRVIMNSFDAASTTSLMRKRMLGTVYNSLKNQGRTDEEVFQMMDKVYKIPPAINTEIKNENKRIGDLMTAAGFPVNKIMLAQNARDMRLSIYEDIIRGQAVSVGSTVKHATEVTKSLIEASQNQAKVLGGKRHIPSQDLLSNVIYGRADAVLKHQKRWFESARKAEMEGDLKKAAGMQLKASLYQNFIGKFVGGVANFMNLAITATPLGLITAGQLNAQQKQYLRDHPDSHDIFKADPEQIKKYAELHGLMRSMTTRAVMGSLAIAAFITKVAMEPDEDDEEDKEETNRWFKNLMATKSGRRYLQKHMPLGIAMAASFMIPQKGKKAAYALDRVLDLLDTYTGKDFDQYSNLTKSLYYAKNDEERQDAIAQFFGNIITTYNVNQPEQFIKFWDVTQSMFDKNEIADVQENERIAKEIYKSADGIVNSMMINGVIDAIRRTADPAQHYNR